MWRVMLFLLVALLFAVSKWEEGAGPSSRTACGHAAAQCAHEDLSRTDPSAREHRQGRSGNADLIAAIPAGAYVERAQPRPARWSRAHPDRAPRVRTCVPYRISKCLP